MAFTESNICAPIFETMSKSNLKDLLEKSAQLVESHTVHLHKNLESIHEQTKKLSQKITRATDPIKG